MKQGTTTLKTTENMTKFAAFEEANPGVLEDFIATNAERKEASTRAKTMQAITDSVAKANETFLQVLVLYRDNRSDHYLDCTL